MKPPKIYRKESDRYSILPDKWSSDDYGRATKIAAMALKAEFCFMLQVR